MLRHRIKPLGLEDSQRYGRQLTSTSPMQAYRVAWSEAQSAQRTDIPRGLDAEPRRRSSDGAGRVARSEVTVMLFDHSGIDVPQGRSDDHEWGAVHDGVRGEGVARDVKVSGRADASAPRNFRPLIIL